MKSPPPLPDRDGVSAARLTMPRGGAWPTVAAFLLERTHGAEEVRRRLAAGEVVLGDGSVVGAETPYRGGETVYLYRDLPDEAPVPGEIDVLYADSDIVVVDKPHFLATMPRGRHVVQTVVVRMRRQLGLPQLSPAHRLDRLTAGVLLLTVRPEVRGAYQLLFERREVAKTYLALAPIRGDLRLPTVVRSRIVKPRTSIQAVEVPGEANAVTHVDLESAFTAPDGRVLGRYRLTPLTGRTHQLRVHLARLGIPIVNDPLYPVLQEHRPGDFSRPLRLLASTLEFTDPLSGRSRRFTSRRSLL
ncbi:MAG: pseudouridine synthase [Actinobacteria bacterium 69-20]|nr:MAG: pseudouridine synthase [Actinobacteria bacterium 69-20]